MIKDLLEKRITSFNFKDTTPKDEDMYYIMDCAVRAPRISANPDIEFLIIDNVETKKRCAEKIATPNIDSAPYLIIVLYNIALLKSEFGEEAEKYGEIDATMASSIISLAAEEKNLSTALLYHATENLRELLSIPANYKIHTVIPIGYSKENAVKNVKLNPETGSVVHINTFL